MTDSTSNDTLVVGTRGSLLARTQTQWVIDRVQAAWPDLAVTSRVISTRGDREQSRPLPEIGGKGLFTEELERALLDGSIDLAVHSAKDLPVELPDGLGVLAYPARVDPRDAWVSADGTPFDDLPPDSAVGTTSLRRQSQLLTRRGDLTFVQLRGNVDTRIKKVHRGDCAGAVLAMAGLIRAGLSQHVTHPFDADLLLPSPGQGALALEGRSDDVRVTELLRAVHDDATAVAVDCERAILGALDAGCRAPVAIFARVDDRALTCDARVIEPDGRRCLTARGTGPREDISAVARQVVDALRADGADEIIARCRPDD